MKKKLFVWAYTHEYGSVQTCALTQDGRMLFTITTEVPDADPRSEAHQTAHKEIIRLVFAGNETLSEEYNIVIVDQAKLEKHMYDGGERNELVSEDFRLAWDKYKMGETVAN